MHRRSRNAKIIATLGPSSSTYDQIVSLFQAGADVFRLNFSHGSHEDHLNRFNIIRKIEQEFSHPIAILMDLQGPKLRIGVLENGKILLKSKQKFTLDLDQTTGNHNRVCVPHPEIFAALQEGTDLLLDDGKLRLKVIRFSDNQAITEVVVGGELTNRKGVNIPGVILPISSLTPKDLKDLEFGLSVGMDWIALSFVQSDQDVLDAKKIIGDQAKIIAKLEKPSAITHLDAIVSVSDAIMVARGDLGVEMLPEEVPAIQKRIIHTCRQKGKPVVVATQMLDSMVNSPCPTRAEASDVATAIYEGSDAVMLSAESASGSYPYEAVVMMDRIIIRTENDPLYRQELRQTIPDNSISYSITAAAREIAHTINISAVVTFTETGNTTLHVARERPRSPILALTPVQKVARFLPLVWGAYPAITNDIFTVAQMVDTACHEALGHKFVEEGDLIIITAGVPFGKSGSTNMLRIAKIIKQANATAA